MSDDRDPAIIIDISNACQLIADFLKDRGKTELESDMLLRSAVLHQLLVLGEAVRRLTAEFKMARPEVDWRGFVGLRNVLIHQYDDVDLDELWTVATKEIPELHQQIAHFLPDQLS